MFDDLQRDFNFSQQTIIDNLHTKPPAINIEPGTPDPKRDPKATLNLGCRLFSKLPPPTPESVADFFDKEFIRKMTIFQKLQVTAKQPSHGCYCQ
ncbi:hypothetical protein PCASD_05490 [Puccinia coronata f. sp. avenae]|nr:hypothetical protein PCASD_05490 [Puccinia coronata f. sp. avenae]